MPHIIVSQEIRIIQSKLRLVEETVCWVNEEEALFKFPQSSYQDVGDANVSIVQSNTLHLAMVLIFVDFFRQ